MPNTRPLVLTALAFCVPFFASSTARAGVDACGDIHVEADARCEVQGGIECEAACEPIAFEAQCAAELQAECRGGCEGELSIEAECQVDCEASCMGQCEVDPGSFECQGSCFADCTANAEGSCSASNNQGECRASVEATCDAQCQVSCESTPTTVDCAGECMASCEGSCSASGTAYLDCQVDCQAQGHAECKADLQGGCEVDCDTEQGALFCDGNYVDHGGNLEECVAALRAIFNIEVTGYAEGRCEGNTCSGEAGFSCTVAGDRKPGRDAAWLTLSGLFLFGLATRTARYA